MATQRHLGPFDSTTETGTFM